MAHRLDPPLTARNGSTLRVLAVCRISTEHQDVQALRDQEAGYRRYVGDHYHGPEEWKVFATRGSGELLDRIELAELVDEIESRRWDLIITEDLGRIARRSFTIAICETAEDCGTRLIALNDSVDTGRADWRTSAMFAAVRHEQYNQDTSKRIRRSLRNRFSTEGLIQTVQYGYLKPPGVKTDVGVTKIPEAGPIYEEWFRRLEGGASFSEIVDFLNDRGIEPSSTSRSGRWSVSLVRNMTYNPILKGVRVRNEMMSMRVNKTGRHRSVKAPPEERLERAVPHLAFIEAARYDRIVAMLKLRNANRGRKPVDGSDPRKGVPRKRTAWPGQHARCGVCGRLCYYGGNGRDGHLMCSGARDYRCWVGTTFFGPLAAERIALAAFAAVESLPEFDAVFLERLGREMATARATVDARLGKLRQREQTLSCQIRSTIDLLVNIPSSPGLRERLGELEVEQDRVKVVQAELVEASGPAPELPSMGRIRAAFRQSLQGLARDSDEFGRLMSRVVPKLEVWPYRAIDGGNVELRARFTVELASMMSGLRGLGDLGGLLRRELTVDLFDPPQRVAHLPRVRELMALGWQQRQIAADVGITQPAVQRSITLARKLEGLGLDDPYQAVTAPPEDSVRTCRHRHARYRFETLEQERLGVEQRPSP